MKRRIGIYLIYDKDGIVDDYIPYYLEQLKTVVSRIIVVCNGMLTTESRQKLNNTVDEVFCRENVGFDAWGYKEAIEYIGWENLLNYDELVITNYTIFGPMYPFDEMFNYMEQHSIADFWGIHRHAEDKNAKYFCGRKTIHGFLPEYPLSNFWVIRSPLLHSYEFKKYWDELPPIKDYIDACLIHEPVFTQTMCDAGYIMDVYSPEENGNFCPSPTVENAFFQLTQERLPVIRRRVFFNPLEHTLGIGYSRQVNDIMKYLKETCNYNTDLIMQNLLRTTNHYDLFQQFNWNYVISDSHSNPNATKKEIGLIMHIFYSDLVAECKQYASNFPNDISIFITTTSEETKETIMQEFASFPAKSIEVEVIPNKGRDISSLIVAAKKFINTHNLDLICFFHDKKMPHIANKKAALAFKERCYEPIMGNSHIVNNIISTFDENPFMGLLSAPPPYHAQYYQILGGNWTGNFACTKELAEKLDLHVDINASKPPIAPYGTCFWFRPQALKKLYDLDLKYEDFPEEPISVPDNTIMHAIERIYPFVVQEAGFYPAYVLSDTSARAEITNLTTMMKVINEIQRRHNLAIPSFWRVKNNLENAFTAQPKSPSEDSNKIEKPIMVSDEELLERVSTKLLFKKIVKRCIPSKIWIFLRRKKLQNSGVDITKEEFNKIIEKEMRTK